MFAKTIRILIILTLLATSSYMYLSLKEPFKTEQDMSLLIADGRLRGYVMTQDIEFLRKDAIAFHKAYNLLLSEQSAARANDQIAWALVAGFGLGLLVVEALRWRRNRTL